LVLNPLYGGLDRLVVIGQAGLLALPLQKLRHVADEEFVRPSHSDAALLRVIRGSLFAHEMQVANQSEHHEESAE